MKLISLSFPTENNFSKSQEIPHETTVVVAFCTSVFRYLFNFEYVSLLIKNK